MLWEPRLRAVDVAQLDVLEERFFFLYTWFKVVFFFVGGVGRRVESSERGATQNDVWR